MDVLTFRTQGGEQTELRRDFSWEGPPLNEPSMISVDLGTRTLCIPNREVRDPLPFLSQPYLSLLSRVPRVVTVTLSPLLNRGLRGFG